MTSMDDTDISSELSIPEQSSSLEAPTNLDSMAELLDITNDTDELTIENVESSKKWCCIGVLGFCLFTNIVMAIAIVIVCLTSYKPSKSCQSSFKAAINDTSFKHNSYPYSITVGDINHDNLTDIVVVNSGTDNIGIFLNYGNNTFASQITFTTGDGSKPVSVALGDFNKDTHLDIAVTSYDTHNIGILFGCGNGSFTSPTTFSTGASRPISIAVGDLNNDRWLDIVVANNGTNTISILYGHENGSFGNQSTYFTGYDSLPYSVVVDDFNNDHLLDIAVANYGTDNVGIFLGYGNGSFAAPSVYSTGLRSSPYSIAVNDFNNDGQLDIAVVNSGTNNIGIFLGDGNGSFASSTLYPISPGSSPQSIAIGDFNQDNQLDIAVSNFDTDNISILIGYGNGSFATPTLHSTGIDSRPFGIAVGDFNNDNQSDIAVVNSVTNNVFVLIGYSLVQSQSPPAYSTGVGSLPYQIAMGDFNNDTQLDLVVANSGTSNVGVFLGYGNGSFREQITYSSGDNSHPYALTVSDLDNDHRPDIIVANSNIHSVGILYGYGNGTFATVVIYFVGDLSALDGIIVDDFNNDNQSDIAYSDYGNNCIGIILGYGNRTFGSVTKYSTGDNWRPYALDSGDFNNDGRLDIAVANQGSGNICIFLGFGNGTFALFIIYSTGDNSLPFMLAIADLDKDNQLDIIVTNSGSGNVGVFFGFGNGSFNTAVTYSTGSGSYPYGIRVADFNNDSWLDIAVANWNMNNIAVLLGSSYGYFGGQTTYPTGSNSAPYSIAIGDFNKDDRLDIATANFGGSNVAILLGHPTEHSVNSTVSGIPILLGDYYTDFSSKTTYSTGSSSQPYSIAVGYLNNDTKMDLIIANSGNENVGILLGYGNGTFATEVQYSIGVGSSPRHVLIDDFNRDNQSDVAVTDPRNDNIILLLGNDNGTFSTQMTYFTGSGSNPNTLAIGDFNNDNYMDLAVANEGTDTIGIFFGFDYTFFIGQNPCDSGDGSQPSAVTIGDFNNDGYLDIVAALYNTNNVAVFLGYGNGSFSTQATYSFAPSSHPWSVAVGDFNNDKKLDIAMGAWGVDSISLALGYGNGNFSEPVLYSTSAGSRPVSVAVGDFNNDACLDITTANYGGSSISVLLGYGNGTFRSVITFSTEQGSQTSSVTVSDINNDTHLDIIVANEAFNNIGVFLGYGNGSFEEQVTTSTGNNSSPWYAIAGDFDKDGRLDVATANYGTSEVGVLYGYGNGTFGNLQTYSAGVSSNPTFVNVGDFNNDNQLDIIVVHETSNNVGIFFGYSDGTFASMSISVVVLNSYSYGVAIGDFNNDNRLDFTVADQGNSNIGVFLANGSKPFGGQRTFSVGEGSHPSSMAVGYFNNDSQLDIAITNYGTNNIGILLGYGNRLFSNVTTYSTGDNSQPLLLAVSDFNNDSIADIVVANSAANNIIILIGHGNGNFSTLMTYSMGDSSEPVSIAVGDFNRDYQLDVVVANSGTNNVCILFGSGNGTFTNPTWYPLGYDSRPNWVIFKDLNNDSWEDIAVATYGTDNIEILLNLC